MNLHHTTNDTGIEDIAIYLLDNQHVNQGCHHLLRIGKGIRNDHGNQADTWSYIRNQISQTGENSKDQSVLEPNDTIANIGQSTDNQGID